MKTTRKLVVACLALFQLSNAQQSGNANYGGNKYIPNEISAISTTNSNQDEMFISIKGIYNEKATSQIAVFSMLQLGKTAAEATNLIDERIKNVQNELNLYNFDIELVVDMISFVPMYDYEVEKKIFNPKTYNEKPSGFELKKNLIIKYKETNDFNTIISICAKNEIYDLAKVDYVTTNYDSIRDQLQKKAMTEFNQCITNYSLLMNTDLTKKEKIVGEGFDIIYPMESYRTYAAFSQANANFESKSLVNNIRKNNTQYYNGAQIKSHSFVINPDITEPTIQISYELTIRIKLKEDQLPKNTIVKNNKYYLITSTGEIKPLQL